MPKATAAIGNKICIAASRPLTLPVQVTNERALHSRMGDVAVPFVGIGVPSPA
jgi:hypothetical protein